MVGITRRQCTSLARIGEAMGIVNRNEIPLALRPRGPSPAEHATAQQHAVAGFTRTQGLIDLTGEYFQAQGANGRSRATCHILQEAWSIVPGTIQRLFDETGGTHPIFNPLDANNENADLSTVDHRRSPSRHGTFGALSPRLPWEGLCYTALPFGRA